MSAWERYGSTSRATSVRRLAHEQGTSEAHRDVALPANGERQGQHEQASRRSTGRAETHHLVPSGNIAAAREERDEVSSRTESRRPSERRGGRTPVRIRVRELVHLLLGLVEQRGDRSRVAHVAVALELGADLDRLVAPQVAADIPAGRRRRVRGTGRRVSWVGVVRGRGRERRRRGRGTRRTSRGLPSTPGGTGAARGARISLSAHGERKQGTHHDIAAVSLGLHTRVGDGGGGQPRRVSGAHELGVGG